MIPVDVPRHSLAREALRDLPIFPRHSQAGRQTQRSDGTGTHLHFGQNILTSRIGGSIGGGGGGGGFAKSLRFKPEQINGGI